MFTPSGISLEFGEVAKRADGGNIDARLYIVALASLCQNQTDMALAHLDVIEAAKKTWRGKR